MCAWNSRFISRVEHDISLVRCAHSWYIMFNTRNKSGISAHPCIILYEWTVTNYKRKLKKLQLSQTWIWILSIRNKMISRGILIKQALVSFAKTPNSARPFKKLTRAFYPSCTRNHSITCSILGNTTEKR
jgi:hypothetical protein